MMASISVPSYPTISSKHLTEVYIALVDQVTKQERPFIPRWSVCLIVFASQTTFRPPPPHPPPPPKKTILQARNCLEI